MAASIHARIARRALEIVGGIDRLARYVGSSPAELQSWLSGRDIPPAQVFFTLLDIATRRRSLPSPRGGLQ